MPAAASKFDTNIVTVFLPGIRKQILLTSMLSALSFPPPVGSLLHTHTHTQPTFHGGCIWSESGRDTLSDVRGVVSHAAAVFPLPQQRKSLGRTRLLFCPSRTLTDTLGVGSHNMWDKAM